MKTSDIEGLERRTAELARTFAPWLVLALGIAVGMIAGPALGVLVLAGGTLLGAIATLWSSLRALVGETPLAAEDAFALGAPSSEEEQKRAVLRAIKDIEFERAVGKISEEDFKILLTRYRAEAKRLLRQIDESRAPERARAEKLANAFLAKTAPSRAESSVASTAKVDESVSTAAKPSGAAKTPSKGKKRRKGREADEVAGAASSEEPETSATVKASKHCVACETANDDDATFCKGCGGRLLGEEASS